MTDIPLNTYIERTDADRKLGECPVPAGSDVTFWFNVTLWRASSHSVNRTDRPEEYDWGEPTIQPPITGYLVHELPREPFVVWAVVDTLIDLIFTLDKDYAEACAKEYGGRVVKLVEVQDDQVGKV